jgi:hypothetical protein
LARAAKSKPDAKPVDPALVGRVEKIVRDFMAELAQDSRLTDARDDFIDRLKTLNKDMVVDWVAPTHQALLEDFIDQPDRHRQTLLDSGLVLEPERIAAVIPRLFRMDLVANEIRILETDRKTFEGDEKSLKIINGSQRSRTKRSYQFDAVYNALALKAEEKKKTEEAELAVLVEERFLKVFQQIEAQAFLNWFLRGVLSRLLVIEPKLKGIETLPKKPLVIPAKFPESPVMLEFPEAQPVSKAHPYYSYIEMVRALGKIVQEKLKLSDNLDLDKILI